MMRLFEWTPTLMTISGTLFSDNINTDGKGGAITISTDDGVREYLSILIEDSTFHANSAYYGGGAIYRQIENDDTRFLCPLQGHSNIRSRCFESVQEDDN